MEHSTVAALASPPGKGGIAIVRVSGPEAEQLLRQLFRPKGRQPAFQSHLMMYGHAWHEGRLLDECMAVLFRAPRSYTREDTAEFYLHGGEYVAASLLKALFELGAQPAGPGEFSKRAFLNGRIDLGRAEAVMQLINASGEEAARAALRDLQGGASAFVAAAQEELAGILSGVAAALDYPEEIDEEEAVSGLLPRVEALSGRLRAACDERAARVMERGLEVAICGRPNVGKSSLLNRLLEEERAIVTEEAGTTRDIVRGSILLAGVRVNFADTAGIRVSDHQVEQIGVRLARKAVEQADLALIVLDQGQPLTPEDEEILRLARQKPHIIVHNKADLPGRLSGPDGILISTQTGEGIDALKRAIRAEAGQLGERELSLLRHMRLAERAAKALDEAAAAFRAGEPLDLCAIHLHEALHALGEVTGDNVTEEMLDELFSTFCVGK